MVATTPELHTTVVRAADGIRFTATGSCEQEVARQLATYVAERCDDMLWPAPAREVRRLLDEQRDADAVATYFANVGQRWDEEWME
jgi:hypothetical protein